MLSGCAPSSVSSGSATVGSSAPASAAASSDAPVTGDTSESTAATDASSEQAARVETHQEFVSVQTQDSTQKILLVFQIPTKWVYKGYNIFEDENGKKVLEIGTPFLSPESTAFSDERVTQFGDAIEDSGAVYLGKQEFPLSEQEGLSRKAVAYCYQAYPSDSDTAWYPCYTFTYTQGYVVPLHFYQSEQQKELSLVKQVLNDLEIFISKTPSASSSIETSESSASSKPDESETSASSSSVSSSLSEKAE